MHFFLTLTLYGGELLASRSNRFTHGESAPFFYSARSWVDPRKIDGCKRNVKKFRKGDKGNKFHKLLSLYQERHSCVEAQGFGSLLRLHHHDGCREEMPAYPNDFDTADTPSMVH